VNNGPDLVQRKNYQSIINSLMVKIKHLERIIPPTIELAYLRGKDAAREELPKDSQ